MAIQSFKCKDTKALFAGQKVAKFATFKDVAERKLLMCDAAVLLEDLKSPPGNRLKELNKDRLGQHSVRVNDQWRVCFIWTANGPSEVEIVDYH
jgi:proteic killer suppression protein